MNTHRTTWNHRLRSHPVRTRPRDTTSGAAILYLKALARRRNCSQNGCLYAFLARNLLQDPRR